jgi:hypothetical protein
MAVGSPPAGRWSQLGFATVPVAFDLDNVFGMLVGEQNSGKSYLVQSNPEAFIINADDSPVVNPKGQACIWPARDDQGRIIDLDGKPLVLTWEAIERKKEQLIQMAQSGVDRPRTIVLDTLFPVLRLHGPMAYEKMYSTLIDFALELRQHGYGVWFVAHLSKKWVSLDETKTVSEYGLSMSEGLRERLSKTVEMIAPVRAVHQTTTEVTKVTTKVGNKDVTRNVATSKPSIRRYLAFNDPEFSHVIRTRTLRPLPNIELSENDSPWETFSRAFSEAVRANEAQGTDS